MYQRQNSVEQRTERLDAEHRIGNANNDLARR